MRRGDIVMLRTPIRDIRGDRAEGHTFIAAGSIGYVAVVDMPMGSPFIDNDGFHFSVLFDDHDKPIKCDGSNLTFLAPICDMIQVMEAYNAIQGIRRVLK